MQTREFNKEVFFSDEKVVKVDRQDIERLKAKAMANERKRVRLCAHPQLTDRLHEMLIIHTKDTYVRPHKHLHKSESFHVIEGRAAVIIFDDKGNIEELIAMGDYLSGRLFYYRISTACYHTLIITSDFLVFHETTNGPFQKSDTIFAPWAPEETDICGVREYREKLAQLVSCYSSAGRNA